MGPRSRLAEALTAAAELLRTYQVTQWPERLEDHASRIRSSEPTAIPELLKEFGGMGSLNDVWIDPRNGNLITSDQVQEVNARLKRFLSEIYELARLDG